MSLNFCEEPYCWACEESIMNQEAHYGGCMPDYWTEQNDETETEYNSADATENDKAFISTHKRTKTVVLS